MAIGRWTRLTALAMGILGAYLLATSVRAATTSTPPPEAQRKFIAAVEQARSGFAASANDMQKGATRPARGVEICKAVPGLKADRWVGRITTLTTNGDGKGVLAVEVGPRVVVKTYNNSFSDGANRTLIEPSSPVFKAAAALAVGRSVEISGTFFRSPGTDCVHELSMTLRGSMEAPDYLMRFTAIRPLD